MKSQNCCSQNFTKFRGKHGKKKSVKIIEHLIKIMIFPRQTKPLAQHNGSNLSDRALEISIYKTEKLPQGNDLPRSRPKASKYTMSFLWDHYRRRRHQTLDETTSFGT
jgi:hypothetical protein